MYNVENKVAVVTGAGNGIGANIVRELLKENIKYVAILDIDDISGMSLQEEVNLKYGKGRAAFFKCDVTKEEQLEDVFNKVIKENGTLDLVVNNAGVADESPEKYKQTIEINFAKINTLKYGKGRAAFFKCDVTKEEQLEDVFNKVIKENGSLDLVVNNAGVADESPEKYKQTIAINFTAVVTSSLKALNLMRVDRGGVGGTIINISSIAALDPSIGVFHVYAATKGAVIQFSNRMGMDLLYSQTKVRVLTVCFGATDTDIMDDCLGLDDIISKEIEKMITSLKTQKALQSASAAARGVVHIYQNGESASTWIVQNNETNDITNILKKGNETIVEFIGFKF